MRTQIDYKHVADCELWSGNALEQGHEGAS